MKAEFKTYSRPPPGWIGNPIVQPFHPNLTDELSDWVVSLQRTEEALVREIKRLERRNSQLKWLAGYMLMGFGVSLVLACLH